MRKQLALGLLTLLLAEASQGQQQPNASNQRAVLQQILTQTFQLSVVGKHLMGIGAETDVHRAGTIVVVQRAGLYASLQRNENASTEVHGLEANVFRGNKDYAVPVGERFYVHAISVGGETVFFGLLSARTIVTAKGSGHLWAVATFYFPAETLANADKDAVFRELDQWFVPESRASANVSPLAAVPQVVQGPMAPTTTPATLTPGMTREQIVAALGAPQREVTFDGRTSLTYPGISLLLKDGQLVSMDQSSQPMARVSLQSEPPGAEIDLDGQFVGSTPSTLSLPAGPHHIALKLSGYKQWQHELHVLPASDITVNAHLEK
ncbi:MAG: hypothetical protein NVS9B4_07270 [Candidatus Acidiferrum sp.]